MGAICLWRQRFAIASIVHSPHPERAIAYSVGAAAMCNQVYNKPVFIGIHF
jgi:hypothetical protein